MVDRLNTKEAIEKRRKKRTMSLQTFLERASKTHNDLDNYDWSKVDLTDKDEKNRVTLYCKKHGEFKIRITHFLNGVGCQYCNGRKKDYNELKKKLQEIHPSLDFSNAKFSTIENNYDVEYVCSKHGVRHGKFYNPLYGEGCKLCSNELNGIRCSLGQDEFLLRAKAIHGDNYIYDKTIYKSMSDEIIITCRKHGDFKQLASNHLKGCGCPKCNMSKLENEVKLFLEENRIIFEQEKQFDWLKNKGQLKLDFYLPQYNIAIECQGEQHFRPIDTWGGEENYKEVCFRDKLKLKQCNENNVTLLYFSHHKPKDKNIIHNLNELKKKIWLLTDKFYEGMQEDNNEKGKKF